MNLSQDFRGMNSKLVLDQHPNPALAGEIATFAAHDIEQGTVIYELSDLPIVTVNDRHAIHIGDGKYLYTIGHVVAMTNHSCDPTLVFTPSQLTFTAKRDIKKGEMYTFDYTLTEDVITSPFDCLCGAPNCKGAVGKKI